MTTEAGQGDRRKAVIVGAGIGGLAAAIALRDAGLDVEVYERTRELKEVGAGLSLWRNGLEALGILGVESGVLEAGSSVRRAELRTADGGMLRDMDLSSLAGGEDAPPVTVVHRADLQRTLLERVGDDVVHLEHECTDIDNNGAGVGVRFANGTEARGDLLVGADGIHSAVRANLHGSERPHYTGIGIWRAVVRFDHPLLSTSTISQALGPGQRFFWGPSGHGQVYWGATKPMQEEGNAPATRWKPLLKELYSGWYELIPALVEATPVEAISWTAAYDREPLERWGRGAVTLLGDAAHLSAPFLGQGACQALEDAVWLGRYLGKPVEVTAALRAFEAHRQGRTAMIVRSSARMGRMLHVSHPLMVGVRNWFFKNGPTAIGMRPIKKAMNAGF